MLNLTVAVIMTFLIKNYLNKIIKIFGYSFYYIKIAI